MDLFAYSQIDALEELAKKNGIEVPRIRGYRLMSKEEPLTDDEIKKMKKEAEIMILKEFLSSEPTWAINPHYYHWSMNYEKLEKKYIKNNEIAWNEIHGKRRKNLKFAIKRAMKRMEEQYFLWNKYAGRDDVLYIHAKLGISNWSSTTTSDLRNEPWFLESVEEWDSSSYCDIYAKLKER